MTPLKKTIKRILPSTIREFGADRQIVLTIEPPNLIGVRAKGCKRTYYLTAQAGYILAVRASIEVNKKRKKNVQ